MANIRIEKKNKPVWPWLLGVVLLGFIAWGVFEIFDDNGPQGQVTYLEEEANEFTGNENQEQPQDHSFAADEELESDVQDYVSFVNDPQNEMALDHEYTAEGLSRLANAIESASENADIESSDKVANAADQIRNKAESIQNSQEKGIQADSVKEAFSVALEAMEMIQNEAYPDMEEQVSSLKQTAKQVQAKAPLLEQKEEVKSFFGESAQVLREFENSELNADQAM